MRDTIVLFYILTLNKSLSVSTEEKMKDLLVSDGREIRSVEFLPMSRASL